MSFCFIYYLRLIYSFSLELIKLFKNLNSREIIIYLLILLLLVLFLFKFS